MAEWKQSHLNDSQIKEFLVKKGFSEKEQEEILNQYKKKKLEKRTELGILLIFIGGFLGFLSFFFTVYDVFPAIKNFIMYSFTSIGVCLAFLGGYYVFE